MKTRVAVVATDLIDPLTDEIGCKKFIVTPDGRLMINRLRQLIRKDHLTEMPTLLLEDLSQGFCEVWDKTPEPVLDLALRLSPETKNQELYNQEILCGLRSALKGEETEWPEDLQKRVQFALFLIDARTVLLQRLNSISDLLIVKAVTAQQEQILEMQAGVNRLIEFA